jgi:hypothetical protein
VRITIARFRFVLCTSYVLENDSICSVGIQELYLCHHNGHIPHFVGVFTMCVPTLFTSKSQVNDLLKWSLHRPYCIFSLQEPPLPKASDGPRLCAAPSLHLPFIFLILYRDWSSVRLPFKTFRANVLTHYPRMVVVMIVDGSIKARIVFQATRMSSPCFSIIYIRVLIL